jgi:hypothetical protein
MRQVKLFIGLMLLLTVMSPMIDNGIEPFADLVTGDENKQNPFGERVLLDDFRKNIKYAVGSPCTIQNDAGTPGDTGNASTNTAKSIGTNPTTSFMGCADASDIEDWYEFEMDQDYNIEVTMSNYANDYDLYLLVEDNGSYGYVDNSWFDDPVETVTSIGTSIEGVQGTYWIAAVPYNPQGASSSVGDYDLDVWTNFTEGCDDWYSPQNDAGTGQDAPSNWSDSPTNLGTNVTDTYTGCLDSKDTNDVFAFDVPNNHTIEAKLVMDAGVDIDLMLHQPNGSAISASFSSGDINESVSSEGTDEEGMPGDYFVNASHWSGNGNYTLYVWTNWSVPTPNLEILEMIAPTTVNQGDSTNIDVVVENDGTLDLNDSFVVDIYLSVDASETWADHHLGNTTTTGLVMNATTSVSIAATIPTGMVEGEYRIIAIVDDSNEILEKSETDNTYIHDVRMTVGTVTESCSNQDEGGSGADAPNEHTIGSVDLGLDIEQEFRGCLDSNDENDVYKVSISSGQTLNVTLVSPPVQNTDFDLKITWTNGTTIASSILSTTDDFSNLEDTMAEGVAGDYYINISYYEGFGGGNPGGVYRLIIGEPDDGSYVAPFNCDESDDMMLGGDASDSSTNPSLLGTNPAIDDMGCLDTNDAVDVYEFSFSDSKNFEISLIQNELTSFSATLYDGSGTVVNGWETVPTADDGEASFWQSLGKEAHEGADGTYKLMISSGTETGNYSLSVTTTAPILPDLEATAVSCGDSSVAETLTGEFIDYSYNVSNLGGPGSGDWTWELNLVNAEDMTIATTLMSGSLVFTDAEGVIETDAFQVKIPSDTPTGTYLCQLAVDDNDLVIEQSNENNIATGEQFFIQNYEEKWANDIDQDGINTTDIGDGNGPDDCPTAAGNSTEDLVGCGDTDGDGWSNSHEMQVNDYFWEDPTQWNDMDSDGMGDNPDGTNGDQCPTQTGPESNLGCPLDTDSDGVIDDDDKCAETPAGEEVDADGCSDGQVAVDDEPDDGISDNVTGGPNGTIDNVDDGTNNDGTDDGNNADSGPSDTLQSGAEEGLLGMSWAMVGVIAAVIVVLVLTLLIMGRSGRDDEILMDNAFGAAAGYPAAGGVDQSITPEQLAYEQQLMASGYPPEYARQYADQHFRPWLTQ